MNGLKVPRSVLTNDLIAGVVMAVVNVPQAVANGVLAGVNSVFGIYSMVVGTTVAAFFTSSVIMNVDSTSATALTAGQTLANVASEEHLSYLVVLGLMVGFFMLIGKDNIFLGQPQSGVSLRQAFAAAEAWVARDDTKMEHPQL